MIKRCRDCDTPIRWVRIRRADGTIGTAMPLETKPDDRGNVVLTGETFGNGTALAEIVKAPPSPDQATLGFEIPDDRRRFLSHFVNCPAADARRNR